ncbi:MAG: hypothetical protein K940chlam9_00774 [Chlamydiae bacterium]|nr:hypothetical protein [Chlamydiota bacterium]
MKTNEMEQNLYQIASFQPGPLQSSRDFFIKKLDGYLILIIREL